VEQGQADRRQAAVAAKTCLVDPTKLQVDARTRDLAMFNLAIDSKLRGCDVVALKVADIAPAATRLIAPQCVRRRPAARSGSS
jgi:hypothetical protein